MNRDGYLEEFLQFWSARKETAKVWFSLYTPQVGEISAERLSEADRERVVADLMALRLRYPKLQMPKGLIEAYARPPQSPDECVFARTTMSVSADLTTRITPCQFGGVPDCANCGCVASAGRPSHRERNPRSCDGRELERPGQGRAARDPEGRKEQGEHDEDRGPDEVPRAEAGEDGPQERRPRDRRARNPADERRDLAKLPADEVAHDAPILAAWR